MVAMPEVFPTRVGRVDDLLDRRDREIDRQDAAEKRGDSTMTSLHKAAVAAFTVVILHIVFPAQAAEFYGSIPIGK